MPISLDQFSVVDWVSFCMTKLCFRKKSSKKYITLRLLTPPMETPDPPNDTPGALKQVVLTPHDIPWSFREQNIIVKTSPQNTNPELPNSFFKVRIFLPQTYTSFKHRTSGGIFSKTRHRSFYMNHIFSGWWFQPI